MNVLTLPLPITARQIYSGMNLRFFWALSGILVAIFLVSYVFQVNLMTQESYMIQDLQKKIKQLSQENKNLEIAFSEGASLSSLELLVKDLNLEKTGQVRYIQVLESQVVTK